MDSGENVWARWKQLSILSDWQTGPSLVQVHMVHGEILLAWPISMGWFPTLHETRSFQRSRLMEGRALQGTRGLRKGSGTSNMALWMCETWSQLSQVTLARLTFLISSSWASVNLMRGLPPSYQNLSHFLKFLNWIPMMQAKVGPTKPPCKGVSERPPENIQCLVFNRFKQNNGFLFSICELLHYL